MVSQSPSAGCHCSPVEKNLPLSGLHRHANKQTIAAKERQTATTARVHEEAGAKLLAAVAGSPLPSDGELKVAAFLRASLRGALPLIVRAICFGSAADVPSIERQLLVSAPCLAPNLSRRRKAHPSGAPTSSLHEVEC